MSISIFLRPSLCGILSLVFATAAFAENPEQKLRTFYYDVTSTNKEITQKACESDFSKFPTTMTIGEIAKDYIILGKHHFSKYSTLSLAKQKDKETLSINGKEIKLNVMSTMIDVVGDGSSHGYGITAIGDYCVAKYVLIG